jgi:hypothetical protein
MYKFIVVIGTVDSVDNCGVPAELITSMQVRRSDMGLIRGEW